MPFGAAAGGQHDHVHLIRETTSLSKQTTYTSDPDPFVTGFFTTSTALGDNLSDSDITADITGFSFTDGLQTFNNTTSIPTTETFDVSTDASGNITAWNVFLQNPSGVSQDYTVATQNGLTITRDFGNQPFGAGESQGSILSDPGTWQMSSGGGSTVPEPGNVSLIGAGLVAIAVVLRKRLQKA